MRNISSPHRPVAPGGVPVGTAEAHHTQQTRRGSIIALSVALIVVIFGFTAFAVDLAGLVQLERDPERWNEAYVRLTSSLNTIEGAVGEQAAAPVRSALTAYQRDGAALAQLEQQLKTLTGNTRTSLAANTSGVSARGRCRRLFLNALRTQ